MKIFAFIFVVCFSIPYSFANKYGAKIKGKVTSTDGKVVEFATAYLKKTSFGGATNSKGYYSISAPSGEYEIGRASCRERV